MKTIDPNVFGTIEQLSAVYAAYENWPDTKILPFGKEDIINAISDEKFDSRSHQCEEFRKEYDKLHRDAMSKNLSKEETDNILSERSRRFHIERCADLAHYGWNDPIELFANLTIK